MPVITDLIRTEADGSISFGNYELKAKTKKSDFERDCGRNDVYRLGTGGRADYYTVRTGDGL